MSKLDGKYKYDEYMKDLYIKNKFSCEVDKNPLGCRILGDYYYTVKYFEKAAEAYKAACERDKDDVSCYKYGVQQIQGKGTPTNIEEGEKNLLFGCQKGVPASCHALGVFKVSAESKAAGVSNAQESIRYFTSACDMDYTSGCVEAAKLHLQGHKAYPELERDAARAFSLLKKACSGGAPGACEAVADMYRLGDGTERNLEMSKEYLKLAAAYKATR